MDDMEEAACKPYPVNMDYFNPNTRIPYGCTIDHIHKAMNEFVDFLGFVNQQLHTKNILRLESMLMPANFSSIVSEFMATAIPKYCLRIVRNTYHNGHPDLIPSGKYTNNSVQHADEGVEIKASRYVQGRQGHNPENA